MRLAVRSIIAVSIVGAVNSIRQHRSANFAGIRLPGTASQHALTIGSPLSAPPLMLVALTVASRRERRDVVRLLAATMVIGVIGEADTWTTIRRPRTDPIATACVVLDIVLPAALIWQTLQPKPPRHPEPFQPDHNVAAATKRCPFRQRLHVAQAHISMPMSIPRARDGVSWSMLWSS